MLIPFQKSSAKKTATTINNNYKALLDTLMQSQAVIEFDMNGIILNANQNFLDTMGYTLDEVKGQHHSMFADLEYVNSPEYRQFWEELKKGKHQCAEYKRFGRNNKEVWIQASYNPILDINGNPVKIVKYAIDITEQKRKQNDFTSQISAIGKSQAIVEFDMNGFILNANQNFLETMDYKLHEIKGKHHKLFVDENFANSFEYKKFWKELKEGKYQIAEYKRLGKNNKEIWIQASYNPIFDVDGKPIKIIKYATDITSQVYARLKADELSVKLEKKMQNLSNSEGNMAQSISKITKNIKHSSEALSAIKKGSQDTHNLIKSLIMTIGGEEALNSNLNADNMNPIICDNFGKSFSETNDLLLRTLIEAYNNLKGNEEKFQEVEKNFEEIATDVNNQSNLTEDISIDIHKAILYMQKLIGCIHSK